MNINFRHGSKFLSLIAVGFLLALTPLFAQTLPTAVQVASNMTIGWNLGNTMEVPGDETAWGNPLTTQAFINSVKAAGFNTVRIPCAWDSYANASTHVISSTWLARVKQVVDYCISNNMYVVLNSHWDGGWLEENCTQAAQSAVNVKQAAYWQQIANYFKSYNEHLLFAGANEPNVDNATQMAVLMSYHQTFINTVRATGGNNSSRTLIVQGPRTDIEKTNTLMNAMPTDQIANRLMVEIHYYTPYNFCLMSEDQSWGNMFYYWGNGYHSTTDTGRNANWGEEADLSNFFGLMKTKFVNKGIPVIIGEFCANKRTNLTGSNLALHTASREYYYKYLTGKAVENGLIPMYWDPGYIGNNSSTLFNRSTGAIVDQGAVSALMQGVGTTPACTQTAITPYIQVNDGSWSGSSSASVASGAKVKFGPQPTRGGSWSWSGLGTSGSTREQTIYPTTSGTATATYTNAAGCPSTKTFIITVSTNKSAKIEDATNIELHIFPNPVANELHLVGQVEASPDASVAIYNQAGSLISTQKIGSVANGSFSKTISVSHLQTGAYFVRIVLDTQVKTLPFIKK